MSFTSWLRQQKCNPRPRERRSDPRCRSAGRRSRSSKIRYARATSRLARTRRARSGLWQRYRTHPASLHGKTAAYANRHSMSWIDAICGS